MKTPLTSHKLAYRAVIAVAITATVVMPCALFSTVTQAAEHTIEIKALKFVPSKLTVRPGDTITWVNRDIVPHTATANDRSWDTKQLNRGQSARITVTRETRTDYFCVYHPHMKASLVIKDD